MTHLEPETEKHYIYQCPAYYKIRGHFHCLLREGLGPYARAMNSSD